MNTALVAREHTKTILTSDFVRKGSEKMLKDCMEGKTHFKINETALNTCAKYVSRVILKNYPSLNIPFHCRWNHFDTKEVSRNELLESALKELSPEERAMAKGDLVITSVLLDAGAGSNWSYQDKIGGTKVTRSEGLAIASWDWFKQGGLGLSFKAEAARLSAITASDIESAFQVSPDNPLVGAEGRAELLRGLGKCVENSKKYFPQERPGSLFLYIRDKYGKSLQASELLEEVLRSMGPLWPGRLKDEEGTNLGDVWTYSPWSDDPKFQGVIGFHKLSQWLSYSLIGPLEELGVKVENPDSMTGLPEYRNGGLFIDLEVLALKDPSLLSKGHYPDSELILEWRALTLAMLDKIAPLVRKELDVSAEDFPMAKVLEGGTWSAGRSIAKEKRADGAPPLNIISDGTVF